MGSKRATKADKLQFNVIVWSILLRIATPEATQSQLQGDRKNVPFPIHHCHGTPNVHSPDANQRLVGADILCPWQNVLAADPQRCGLRIAVHRGTELGPNCTSERRNMPRISTRIPKSSPQFDGTHGPALAKGGAWQSREHTNQRIGTGQNKTHRRKGPGGEYLGSLPDMEAMHGCTSEKLATAGSLRLPEPIAGSCICRTQPLSDGSNARNAGRRTPPRAPQREAPKDNRTAEKYSETAAQEVFPKITSVSRIRFDSTGLAGIRTSNATSSYTLRPHLRSPSTHDKSLLPVCDVANPRHAHDDALIRNTNLLAADGQDTAWRQASRNKYACPDSGLCSMPTMRSHLNPNGDQRTERKTATLDGSCTEDHRAHRPILCAQRWRVLQITRAHAPSATAAHTAAGTDV